MLMHNQFANQHQTLVPFLLLALFAHVLAISVIKVMKRPPMQPPAAFDVKLLPNQSIKASDTASLPTPLAQPQAHITSTQLNQIASKSVTKQIKIAQTHTLESLTAEPSTMLVIENAVPTNSYTAPAIERKTEKPNINIENLLSTARQIASYDAHNAPKDSTDQIALADRAFSPEVAKVFATSKKRDAGITQYASGMIKVVSANGSEYCLQQSTLPNRGAFESDAIPMTCP